MSIVEKAIRKRRGQSPGPKRDRAADPASWQASSAPKAASETLREGSSTPAAGAGGEEALPLQSLQLDRARLIDLGLAPPEDHAERLATEYQSIKRPLLNRIKQAELDASRGERRVNRIVVTSALPGEGKTFTAINLALSLARERDYRVVLIDGDILKPSATEALGLLNKPGFGDLMADESRPVQSVLFETDYHGMWFMPAGHRDPLLAEHLSSRRADQVLSHIARMRPATILVIDSPPLLPTSESALLAARAKQVVMVVKAGATAQHTLRHAMASLNEDHDVSLLLNQAELPRWQDYYSQYPGYYGKRHQ